LVANGVIPAHTPDLGPHGLQIAVAVAESASLQRAARGVVFGIEEQHQGLVAQLIAAALGAVLISQGNQWGAIASAQGCCHRKESVWPNPKQCLVRPGIMGMMRSC